MSIVSDSTNLTLRAGLNRRAERQNLLASNLANIDTPGFQPKDLAFEGALKEAAEALDTNSLPMVRTESGHMSSSVISIEPHDDLVERPDVVDTLDGNGVDLDKELVRTTDNAMKFTGSAEMLRRRYNILQSVINDYRA